MASNIEVASYDPKKVNLVMNGKIITGFASDSMITIARNEDTVTTQVGVKGDVAYNENANESGTITVTLMGTSSSLPYVRSLALKRKEVSVMIVDANDSASVNVAEERCRVIKPPDITRAKEIGSESVSIFVPSLNVALLAEGVDRNIPCLLSVKIFTRSPSSRLSLIHI